MSTKNMTAIVLKVSDLGESDKIVTFYSKQLGKLSGVAKGAKRSKKRFSNKLEIFSLLDVVYDDRGRSGLVLIAEAELLSPFLSLRENYDRYVSAGLACELIYYWSKDYDADKNIFTLLSWTLQSIDRGGSPQTVQIFFQIKLYTLLGYRLHLAGCIKCNTAESPGVPYLFHPARHGLLCRKCSPAIKAPETVSLSLNTIKLLQLAQDMPMEKLARLRFSATSTREALNLFRAYGQYLLQREIAAWNFLDKSAEKKSQSR
ncbi:MAG: DNA repair protein RecO [Desulfobulbales bacterium]|nr:DNA repair protein RecO [Desulfobulbales bacterium]